MKRSPFRLPDRRGTSGRHGIEPLETRIAPAVATPFPLGSLDGQNGFAITGPGGVGDDASVLGDVNGDGFDDVLIAAFGNPGGAYVIFGKAGGFDANVNLGALNGMNGFAVTNPSGLNGSNFATTAGGVGDLNGDGFADFAVGSNSEKIGAANAAGAVYVIFGKATFGSTLDVATLNGANGFKLTGSTALGSFGTSIDSAGDFNADGFDDFVITASGANGGFSGKGAAYVFFGKAAGFAASASVTTLTGANGFEVIGEAASDFLSSATTAGDVNGDGFGDLILGAGQNNAVGADSGAAYVVFGKADAFAAILNLSALNGTNGFKLRGVAAGDNAGSDVSSAGDLNGDGFSDLLIGAPAADPGGNLSGAAYLVFGKSASFGAVMNLSALNGTNGFRLTGAAANNFAGYDVAAAGDVNGDGFDDAIVAARIIGGGFGGAYVIYGRAAGFAATTSLATLQVEDGLPITGTLGYRVSGAGDVNGDGFDDVLIGARDFNTAYVVFGFDTGAVTHPGGVNVDTLTGDVGANVIVAGQAADTLIGNGGADVLRGGQGDDVLAISGLNFKRINGGLGTDTLRLDGAGLVLNLPLISGLKLASIEQIDLTGSGANRLALSAINTRDVLNLSPTSNTLTVFGDAGDFVDFGAGWIREANQVIGADTFKTFTNGAATLRIADAVGTSLPSGYLLPIVGNELPGLTINGVAAVDTASKVSPAGDVNGDGFDDFLIGAGRADPHGDSSGAAYLVFGKATGFPSPLELSTLDGTNGFTLLGESRIDYAGYSLSSAGDFNGDGFADVIVGSFNASGVAGQAGTAYVVFGKSGPFASVLELSALDGNNGFKLRATPFSILPGLTVHSAGDVNGDGFDDVVVGAPSVTTGTVTQKGAAYVVFGRAASPGATFDLATLNGTNGFAIAGATKFELAGVSVSGGDVNADGFSDVIVGAKSGKAYIVFGKAAPFASTLAVAALNGTNGFTIDGVAFNGLAGSAISAAGDVNGDGLGDLLVGAPILDIFTTKDVGGAFVVYGKPGGGFGKTVKLVTLPVASGFSIIGKSAGDFAGQAVSAAGDVNGDGFDDIFVGAPFADSRGSESGEAYVIYGKALSPGTLGLAELDGTNGFVLIGTASTRAGDSLSAAGDVDGDGFDDLLVGTFGSPGGRVGAGISYLIHGFDTGAVTHPGDTNANTLTGDAGANAIVGGQSGDTLIGNGGVDALRGGEGDDIFAITDLSFRRITGGAGMDTLRLDGSGMSLNLPALADTKLSGIERIDIKGTGVNSLTLSLRDVLNLSPTSNTLVVTRDISDVVSIGSGWISQGNEVIGGDSFLVFKQGAATLKLQEGSLAATLVNATTATFTDADGDLVTIKVSKGVLSFADFNLAPAGTVGGFQLRGVNFSDDGIEFKDANLTISAARTALGGDGKVNVGFINATGVDLGKVNVEGDLGALTAGDATLTTPGLDALTVGSLGLFGTSTQAAGVGPGLACQVVGKLGTLTVASDIVDYNFTVGPTAGVAIDTVRIGGSIRGDRGFGGGIFTNGSVGLVQIGQDIRGGTGTFSSILSISGNVDSLSIGGSLVSGAGIGGGSVFVSGTLGPTQIGGDIDGGKIFAGVAIKNLAVTGSVLRAQVLAGYTGIDTPFKGDATIGAVTIGGDWVASDLVAGAQTSDPFFGNGADKVIAGGDPAKIAKITSIAIKGQAIGTPGGADHFGFIAEEIGSFTVGGTKFPLVAGVSNDLAGFYVGSTLDVKVREVNATAPAIDPPLGGGGGGGGGTSFEFPLSTLNGTNGFEFALTDPVGDGAREVDAAGDVNNDGFMDFIVSARNGSPGGVQFAGEAYVVFGKGSGFPASFDANALDGTNGFRIQGNVASAQLGVGAGGAGDFNNDGFDDVIVGAIDLKGLSGSDTSAYIVFGKASFAATPSISVGTLNGSNGVELRAPHDTDTGVGFRMGVSGADINNDGFDDAIVGVVNADSNGSTSGAVFVVFGRANSAATLIDMGALNGSNGFRFDSGGLNERIGGEVSAAGDINGDGIDDFVIGGAYAADMNKRGQAYVIFGKTTAFAPNFGSSALNGTTGFRISGESNYGVLGLSVDAAGDVNGDGFGDVVVGAPYASITGEFSGATYVIYGRNVSASGPFPTDIAVATLNGTNGFRIVGEGEYDYAGRVAGVGDVNGDGFDDIGIGAIGAGTPDKFRGNAYVVYGKANSPASFGLVALTAATGRKFIGVADQDQTGTSIAGVGDVNNDGIDDLLIGAPKANATSTSNIPGAAYLVFGGGDGGGVLNPLSFSADNKTVFFTDVDGDRVSVKTSLGTFDGSEFTRVAVAGFNGAQLQKLELGPNFAGANITITATRGPLGGDGFVNVGFLDAAGVDLGTVVIEGDLGQIDAGNGTPLKQAVPSLTVQSLGRLGLSTQAAASASLESNIAGKLGKLTVKSDVVGAFLNVAGSVDDESDDTGAINIGGALRGGAGANSGTIFAGDDIVSVKIGQGIIGGAGAHSGSIESGGRIGNITLGNSLLGGAGVASGSLISASTLGVTSIDGDLTGRIFAKGNLLPTSAALALAIKSIAIDGSVSRASLFAGFDRDGAPVNADVQIGAVTIGRDWLASSLALGVQPGNVFFGDGDTLIVAGNPVIARIASITIAGQALGSVAGGDHFGFVAEEIGAFKIGATVFPLAKGASTDLAGLPVGTTGDLRVREV